jgi:hypothetical protein
MGIIAATLLPLSKLRMVASKVAFGFDKLLARAVFMVFLLVHIAAFVNLTQHHKAVYNITSDQNVAGSSPAGCTIDFSQ